MSNQIGGVGSPKEQGGVQISFQMPKEIGNTNGEQGQGITIEVSMGPEQQPTGVGEKFKGFA